MKYFLNFLTAICVGILALTGMAQAQIVAPPADTGKELPVLEVFINDQGNAMVVENTRNGSLSIQSEVTALCAADTGLTYKIQMRGGPDYILIALAGDKIVAGGQSASWKGCSVDLGSFGFTPEMLPFAEAIVADFPLLAKAHNVGTHTGHFTSDHLKAVLTAFKKESFGIVAEQTVQTYVGADWPYFKQSALVPAVNQAEGLVVNTGSVTYLVWKPVECAVMCMTASKLVYVHHVHSSPAPKAKVSAPTKKKKHATATPRKTVIHRPAPGAGIEMLCTGCN